MITVKTPPHVQPDASGRLSVAACPLKKRTVNPCHSASRFVRSYTNISFFPDTEPWRLSSK